MRRFTVQSFPHQLGFPFGAIIYLCYNASYLNEEVDCTEPAPSVTVPCRDIIYLFYNTSYLNEEVHCTELSTSVRVPFCRYYLPLLQSKLP
jgi:hypothetical protein